MPSSAAPPPDGRGGEQRFPPLLVICGPTATGKTALSLAIAERFAGAEIISADSRQVYRGMDIGTAKVAPAERARVAHHGLDLVEPDEPFSAVDYLRHARAALDAIARRGGWALLVGGTGLYIRAVARGMPLDETGRDTAVRAGLEEQLAGEGLHVMVARLRSQAPRVAARTDLANPRRVVRALERVHLAGDELPPEPRGYPGRVAWIGLRADRATTERWIAERARWQFGSGLLDEAASLRARYDPALPPFSAMGYREAFGALDGTLSRDEAIERTIRRTRQFARRQQTWFGGEPGVEWLDAATDPLSAVLAHVDALVRRP